MTPNLSPLPDTDSALRNLETLYIFCDRFSHSIRTPLSVSMGIVDDICSGFEVGSEDFADAQNALQTILHTLNSVRDVTQTPSFHPEETLLSEFLRENLKNSFSLDLSCTINSSLEESAIRKSIDCALLYRAMRCILRYVSARISRFPAEGYTSVSIALKSTPSEGTSQTNDESISLSFRQKSPPDWHLLKEAKDLHGVAKIDHSPEALGLLFAEQVFLLHQGCCELHILSAEDFQLEVYL